MAEHPAVEFLKQAHERAERSARATTVHQPYDEWEALGIDGDSDVARSIWEVPMIARRWANTPAARPIMEHIALNDPAAVLRRIAAERELLAEHYTLGRMLDFGATRSRPTALCTTCRSQSPLAEVPCRTVLLLAQAWGWEEET